MLPPPHYNELLIARPICRHCIAPETINRVEFPVHTRNNEVAIWSTRFQLDTVQRLAHLFQVARSFDHFVSPTFRFALDCCRRRPRVVCL
jgi:hypothetical protein